MFAFLEKNKQASGLAGVSIMPEGVAVAVLQRGNDPQPRLLHCHYTPISSPAEVSQVVEDMLSDYENIIVSSNVRAGEFRLQMIEAPQVPAEEMQAAVRWKMKDILDFDVNDAIIDVFEIPGQKERGRTPMVYVVAAEKQRLQQQVDQLHNAEVDLRYLDIPELIQRNIASLLEEDEKGVAMLHFDANGGLITLSRDSTLYLARNLDTGYRELEMSLAASAEGDGAMALEGMAPAQQRAFDNIILEVQRSLDYYESHFAMPPIGSLVIAPMPTEIPGMLDYIASNLGLQVRMLDLNTILTSDEPLANQAQADCFTAIGAALRHSEAA